MRFTRIQMVPTPFLLAEPPRDTGKVELAEHNPLASRSTVTSTTTLPKQGQAEWAVDGDRPRASGSLLKVPGMARKVVVEGQLSSTPDPWESPIKDQSMTTLGEAQAMETIADLWLPKNSVCCIDFSATYPDLTFNVIF